MKLLRLKINDPEGFRSLPSGFEFHFRTEWRLHGERDQPGDFAPFVCAGRNGSGKSNLLEALAAIFFQVELRRVRRGFLPEMLLDERFDHAPAAFELDYLIRMPASFVQTGGEQWAQVQICKVAGEPVQWAWENREAFDQETIAAYSNDLAELLLPQYVLGYSSGENEILSLPFFKLRFVQWDEYRNALTRQEQYPGYPETRLAYLDSGFSQAILLCNLLLQDESDLQPFREEVGIGRLREFRIIIRRSIPISVAQLASFDLLPEEQRHERRNRLRASKRGLTDSEYADLERREVIAGNPALYMDESAGAESGYRLNLMHLLEGGEESSRVVDALKRCATLSFHDDASDSLILDFWVNDTTRNAFRENFDYASLKSPLGLFRAFQVLLTLNLYAVDDALKNDLYTSTSHYVSETVPTLASDQRIMRFKFVQFDKRDVPKPVVLKDLSDGEHQWLHSLGLCLLFRNSNALFLLDEPETHFNPAWRASFISRLRDCMEGQLETGQEMLITTHSPFLISDSKPDKVLVFAKDKASGRVSIHHPDYNTLGASINKITMNTFGKRETIGRHAQALIDALRVRSEHGAEDKEALIAEVNQQLGDSVEKVLLINSILDGEQSPSHGSAG